MAHQGTRGEEEADVSTGDLLRYLRETSDRDDGRRQMQMLDEERWRRERAEREAERRESEDAWRREVRERELRREVEQGRRDARLDDLLAALLHATTGRIAPGPELESEEEGETPVVPSPRLPTVVPHYPSTSTPRLTAAPPPDVPETVRFAASTGLERAAVLIDRRNEEVGAQMARAAFEEQREYTQEQPGEPAGSRTTPPYSTRVSPHECPQPERRMTGRTPPTQAIPEVATLLA